MPGVVRTTPLEVLAAATQQGRRETRVMHVRTETAEALSLGCQHHRQPSNDRRSHGPSSPDRSIPDPLSSDPLSPDLLNPGPLSRGRKRQDR